MKKWVYFFGAGKAEGDGTWRDLLGGKGAGLAEMTKIGLPVPAGFTISTEETILNLGLNDRSVEGLASVTRNERFAYDAYRRFVQMYSTVVMGLSKEDLEHRLRAMRNRLGVKEDTAVPASGWKELVAEYKAYFLEKSGQKFPDAPIDQLWGAIGAVFGSWMAEKAVTYRRVEKITGLLGTAVNVVQMVFGNKNLLRRLPRERPGRRRSGRHSNSDASARDAKDHAQGVRAARESSSKT